MEHKDCKYYLPIDAFKGICKRDKNDIKADDTACENFEKAQKCIYCSNFKETNIDMGRCKNKYDAFPHMNASTCNEFHWN